MTRRRQLRRTGLATGTVLAIGIALLFALQPFAQRAGDADGMMDDGTNAEEANAALDLPAWMDIELVDALTGEAFQVRDLIGRPILLESFAVWCSICLRQQKEMAKLVESHGEAIVHVSLDTDPNEDRSLVREHALRHGFDWLFAVAPIELTQALIDAFGLTVVNAPRAPVVLIESDGSARLLENGVKSAERLAEIVGLEPNPAETVDG